jgi:hypothetical protein
MLLPYRSWVQRRGVKPGLRHFPPSKDERSRNGRPGRGGRKPRKGPILRSEEDNIVHPQINARSRARPNVQVTREACSSGEGDVMLIV